MWCFAAFIQAECTSIVRILALVSTSRVETSGNFIQSQRREQDGQ